MIKDLRTNIETANVQKVLDGDLDIFIKEYLMMEGQKKTINKWKYIIILDVEKVERFWKF